MSKKDSEHIVESRRLIKKEENVQSRSSIEIREAERKTFLPVAGGIISVVTVGVTAFSILLTLKVENVLHADYWVVFSPLLLILAVLLVLTQSRTISTRFPLISRLAWLLCVMCMIAFTVLLAMKLDGQYIGTLLEYTHIFIPLWILFSVAFVLGFAAVIVAICFSNSERRRTKYLTSGLPLIFGIMVFFPFALLVSFKLETLERYDYEWAYVFIPLFVADGFFMCLSSFLLLFTMGSQDSALFTIGQIVCFLLSLPAAITFEVLLVLKLDGGDMPFWAVMIPVFCVEVMYVTCGINMILTQSKPKV